MRSQRSTLVIAVFGAAFMVLGVARAAFAAPEALCRVEWAIRVPDGADPADPGTPLTFIAAGCTGTCIAGDCVERVQPCGPFHASDPGAPPGPLYGSNCVCWGDVNGNGLIDDGEWSVFQGTNDCVEFMYLDAVTMAKVWAGCMPQNCEPSECVEWFNGEPDDEITLGGEEWDVYYPWCDCYQ